MRISERVIGIRGWWGVVLLEEREQAKFAPGSPMFIVCFQTKYNSRYVYEIEFTAITEAKKLRVRGWMA